jgi:hypothetical protein
MVRYLQHEAKRAWSDRGCVTIDTGSKCTSEGEQLAHRLQFISAVEDANFARDEIIRYFSLAAESVPDDTPRPLFSSCQGGRTGRSFGTVLTSRPRPRGLDVGGPPENSRHKSVGDGISSRYVRRWERYAEVENEIRPDRTRESTTPRCALRAHRSELWVGQVKHERTRCRM